MTTNDKTQEIIAQQVWIAGRLQSGYSVSDAMECWEQERDWIIKTFTPYAEDILSALEQRIPGFSTLLDGTGEIKPIDKS